MNPVLIRIRDARKTYTMGQTAVRALDGVSLDVCAGEFLSIVGPSGSGKSTLMHVMGCLDVLSSGSYHLEGTDVSQAGDEELSAFRNRRIGFVFQQFNLLADLSVLENIAMPLAYAGVPRAERLRRARRVAEELGLGERLDHHPHELSGGQAQRVAIARALIHDPDVLFADEPTGALDSKTGREIMAIFDRLNERGRTLILVTHDANVAAHAKRVVTLSDGKIVSDTGCAHAAIQPTLDKPPPAPHHGLRWRDLLRMGFREGLCAHKLRTGLTMLGVIIGVASVIAMSSVSQGSKRKQADQIRALGSNLVRVLDRRLEEQALYDARIAGSQGLSRDDAAALQGAVPGVRLLSRMRNVPLEARQGPQLLRAVRVLGVDEHYLAVNNLRLALGVNLKPMDQTNLTRVAVVGAQAFRDLGVARPEDANLVLGGQPFRIIGVLEDKHLDTTELEAAGANDSNRDILIPLQTLLKRSTHLGLRSELDEIQLQIEDEDRLAEAGRAIRRILDARHAGVADFDIVIPLDLLKSKQQSQRLLDVLSLCISAISLVVGGIGIMNIMLASVTERLKEIGIRRAVGARSLDIRRQFLLEASLISSAGGLIGILLAVLGVFLAAGPLGIPVVFDLPVITVAVLAAVLTGLVFGAFPAAKAATQNLVEILQRD